MEAGRLSPIFSFYRELSSTLPVAEVASQAALTALELFQAQWAACALAGESETWIVRAASRETDGDPEASVRLAEWARTAVLPHASTVTATTLLADLDASECPLAIPVATAILATPLQKGSPHAGVMLVGLNAQAVEESQHLLAEVLTGAMATGLLRSAHDAQLPNAWAPAFDTFPDPCEIYDAAWRLQQVNAAHRQVFALPDDAIGWDLGRVASHCCTRLTQPEALARLLDVPQPEPTSDGCLNLDTPDPDGRSFQRIVVALPATHGYLAVYRDVTDLRRAERAKDEFLSIAGHELRTPLTAVKGFSQLLQRQLQKSLSSADAIKKHFAFDLRRAVQDATAIREETDRLARLVDQLLDVSRIEMGRPALTLRPTDLSELLSETLKMLRVVLEGRTIVYDTPAATRPVVINGDADRLNQVVVNLVENATRYSPPDQPIVVSLNRTHSTGSSPAGVILCVQDSGIGIPTQDLTRVFERFYRVDEHAPTARTGLGLGLYICAEIVRHHQGRIWAESAGPNKGSRFCVELPLQRRSRVRHA